MTLYEKFKSLPIDHSCIGLEQSDTQVTYYCTPRDAQVIGWAGVDGIHYCTIPEFAEMIFAVSPMNFGDCVHPIARSFSDLLRLLLTCGDMAALEQCYAWDEEQFKAFLLDCPVTGDQRIVLDFLAREFSLEPIEDVYSYVKTLQKGFDLSAIPYTEDYYDEDMNPAAPMPAEWIVTYNGGFWSNEGKPGTEVSIQKHFRWGKESWYVPAVYLCEEGLVLDICKEADPRELKVFIDKWDLYNEERNHYTKNQQLQIHQEHPLNVSFDATVYWNGKKLRRDHGCGVSWVPVSCRPTETEWNERDAQRILEHYELDTEKAWAFHRCTYQWATAEKTALQELRIKLVRSRVQLPGICFTTPVAGESVTFSHPLTGLTHTLTVEEVEDQKLPPHAFHDAAMEYPSHFTAMSYRVSPEISSRELIVKDCAEGDPPRMKNPNEFTPVTFAGAAAIGIIGGADGPTTVLMGGSAPHLKAACSSLHFEPVSQVQWQIIFNEKLMDDVFVDLI